jgi:predicted transcriptional regulator
MKAVLISIQPKWVELIASGKKTIEVRKTRPKLETPFKCYIYCTIGNGAKGDYLVPSGIQCGKVIGEFVCDKIICSQAYYDNHGNNHLTNVMEEDIKRTCLAEYDLWDYIGGKASRANEMFTGWLWHISDLKIYDKPKELGEFRKPFVFDDRPMKDWCHNHCEICDEKNCKYDLRITRPFQSWGYVEELGE